MTSVPWVTPLPYILVATKDSNSFSKFSAYKTGLPLLPHVGAYSVVRKYHRHEGIDLYAPQGCPVMAVEAGIVTAIMPFTGLRVGSPWWEDTYAVFVEGASGVVVYGEISPHIALNATVNAGALIGVVTRVLKVDKGRPMSMLHLELHTAGSKVVPIWDLNEEKPEMLRDPTYFLLPLAEV